MSYSFSIGKPLVCSAVVRTVFFNCLLQLEMLATCDWSQFD